MIEQEVAVDYLKMLYRNSFGRAQKERKCRSGSHPLLQLTMRSNSLTPITGLQMC
jgi:hypothetical protein